MSNSANIISVTGSSSILEINYLCKTKHVIYSIADFVGNVVKWGNYNCIENNKLEMNNIPKGMYIIFIIDGDSLTKICFIKN